MKRLSICVLAAVVVLQVAVRATNSAEPAKQTKVTVSEETTVVTKPLDEEGYVDLLAAVNQRFSNGVTPENNAAVPLRMAMGLSEMRGEADRPFRNKYDKMLGIEPGDYGIFVALSDIAKQNGIDDVAKAYDLQAASHDAPFTAEDFPTIADWIEQNEAALTMVVEATKRPRYYTPYIASKNDEQIQSPTLVMILLPALQESRETARALLSRAMLNAGEGRTQEAIDDLLAMHRLARLVSQDPTLVGGLVGIAIDSMANHGDVALVSSTNVPAEQLLGYLEQLDKLPTAPTAAERIGGIERLMFVDVVVSMARGRVGKDLFGMLDGNGNAGASLLQSIPQFAMGEIDWDAMLRDGHHWYDRMEAAMSKATFAEQSAALDAIDNDLQGLSKSVKSPWRIATIVLSDSKTRGQILGKQIGETLMALLLPATRAVSQAEHRGKMLFELSRVAIALEAFKVSVGEYPDSLDALTAGVLASVPTDTFSNAPLKYERRGEGYLLYSIGPNGKDDKATSYIHSTSGGEHVPEDTVTGEMGDDLVVRVE